MASPKQARKPARPDSRRVIKKRMLDRDEMSVTELAALVGHPISTVSKAINHGRYPRVCAKIMEALDV